MPQLVAVYPSNGSSYTIENGVYFSAQYIADVQGVYNWTAEIIRPSDSAVMWSRTGSYNLFASSTPKFLDFDVLTAISPGTYYWRLTFTSAPATVTNNPTTNTVTLVSAPSVTGTAPANNAVLQWSPAAATTYPVTFAWATTAVQTEYKVDVRRISDNATVVNTGFIVSTAKSATLNIPVAYRDTPLKWEVVIKASNGGISANTVWPYTLRINSIPTTTITSPTEGQAVTSGTPSVTFSYTVPAGQVPVSATAALYENGTTLVWSKTVTSGFASPLTISDSTFALKNSTNYSYRVTLTDDRAGVSDVAVRNFSTAYTAPASAPAPSLVTTNYAELGYNQINWSGTSVDADFYAWELSRKDDLLDPDTGSVVLTGAYKIIGYKYVNETSNQWFDYTAPSGYRVQYQLRQIAFKFNSMVPGAVSATNTGDISSSYYWLIGGTNGATSTVSTFKMYHVTDDSYTEERERAEFVIIGRGRYVENGTNLGARGQLTCKLRSQGGLTARAKKIALEQFQEAYAFCTMRTPFGDEFQVSLQDLGISRISGVGRSEFCDVTVPYVEVTNR